MKKRILFFITPLLMLSLMPSNKIIIAKDDVNLDSTITSNMIIKLKSAIELNTNIKFNYDSNIKSVNIINQFDNNNRVNLITVNDQIIEESYYSKDLNGNALESYLSVSNTVNQRYKIDGYEQKVTFSSLHTSPFINFVNLDNEKINSYFEVKEENDSFLLKPTSLGYGVLTDALLKFYEDYDNFVWDISLSKNVENLIFTIDKNGNPIKLTFDKVKKDFYGGIKENYIVDIKNLEKVRELKPLDAKMSYEENENLINKISQFQTLINNGNFTQNILVTYQKETLYNYSNYYALNEDNERKFPKAMLCSTPLTDPNQGETFLGVFETSSGLSTLGISVDSDYSSAIHETYSNNILDVIPNFDKISANYFFYEASNNIYKFDLNSFTFSDDLFFDELLQEIFAIGDIGVNNLYLYVYNYGYSFNYLKIGFDSNGYLYGTLSFNYEGMELLSNFNFTNIGTTDLESIDSISKAVNYYLSKGGKK